jgi:hypothetical protein
MARLDKLGHGRVGNSLRTRVLLRPVETRLTYVLQVMQSFLVATVLLGIALLLLLFANVVRALLPLHYPLIRQIILCHRRCSGRILPTPTALWIRPSSTPRCASTSFSLLWFSSGSLCSLHRSGTGYRVSLNATLVTSGPLSESYAFLLPSKCASR